MSSRWLLVFGITRPSLEAVVDRLGSVDGALVAHEVGADGRPVVTVEVPAVLDVVDEVTVAVRSVDPRAQRLHDTIVVEPPVDEEPCTASLDYEADDDPVPCEHCAGWRFEYVEGPEGSVLREWHRQDCPTYVEWS